MASKSFSSGLINLALVASLATSGSALRVRSLAGITASGSLRLDLALASLNPI